MQAPSKRRLFAAGRIGPARTTPTGTVLRLVTVINAAGLKITEVRQAPPKEAA